jgi:hypothetical protein
VDFISTECSSNSGSLSIISRWEFKGEIPALEAIRTRTKTGQ